MSTSYTNPGGSGNRSALVRVTAAANITGDFQSLVDGTTTGSGSWFNNASAAGETVTFDFSAIGPVIIDEATYYQDNATAQGTWKWQGSLDAQTWTDVGTSFTLGGAVAETITALNGNTTAYVFYRILGVSGSTSGSPFALEMQFKISAAQYTPSATSTAYTNSGGTGSRTSQVTVTATANTISGGSPSLLVDGNTANNTISFPLGVTVSGKAITFDFSAIGSVVITEAKWYQGSTGFAGYWQWQGSNDNTNWANIGWVFSFGWNTITQVQNSLVSNSSAYKYYRLNGISGTTTNQFLQEVEFKIALAVSVLSRRTLSPFGTRVGSRKRIL